MGVPNFPSYEVSPISLPPISLPEYRVLRVLFRHIGTTGKAWPGQTRIAGACGLNRGHVSRLLNRLERWGVVEVPRRGHMKSRKAAEYRIRPPSKWPTEKPPD